MAARLRAATNAAAGHRNLQRTHMLLAGALGDHRPAKYRKARRANIHHIAHGPVENESGNPIFLRDGTHIGAGQRKVRRFRLRDDDGASGGSIDGRMQHQVIARTTAHRISRARDARDRRPQRPNGAIHDLLPR